MKDICCFAFNWLKAMNLKCELFTSIKQDVAVVVNEGLVKTLPGIHVFFL